MIQEAAATDTTVGDAARLPIRVVGRHYGDEMKSLISRQRNLPPSAATDVMCTWLAVITTEITGLLALLRR